MITRRIVLASAALLAVATVVPAARAETVAYTDAAFEAALSKGRSILVEIHAPWCPVCAAQAPILSKLEADPKFKDLLVVRVDFDNQKDVVRRLRAQAQSTLITFKSGKETGRSVGDTNPTTIAALLDRAI